MAKCSAWLGVTLAIIFGGRGEAAGTFKAEGGGIVLQPSGASWEKAMESYKQAFERLQGSSAETFDALALRVFHARSEILIHYFIPLLLEPCAPPKLADLTMVAQEDEQRPSLEARIAQLRSLDAEASRDEVIPPTGCLSARWLLPPSPQDFVAFWENNCCIPTTTAATPSPGSMTEEELCAARLLQELFVTFSTLMSHLLALVDVGPKAYPVLLNEVMPAVANSLTKLFDAFSRLRKHLISDHQLHPEFIQLLEMTANVAVTGIYGLEECEREIAELLQGGHIQEEELLLFWALARRELRILDPHSQEDQEYVAGMSRVSPTKRATG